MHVAINAQKLLLEHSFRNAGISRYSYHLLASLAEGGGDWEFTAFVPRLPPPGILDSRPNFRLMASRLPTERVPLRVLWEQTLQPLALVQMRADLLHSLAYAVPLLWRGPSVVTILDLSFLRFPDAFNRGNRLYLSVVTRFSARRARRVITISEHARREIVALLAVPASKVVVTHCGVEEAFRPVEDRRRLGEFLQTHGVVAPYILYVGTIEPRKNVDSLVRAFAILRGRGVRHHLVIVGAPGWKYSRVFGLVGELGLQEVVLFAGYAPFDELPLWYNGADVFVYPSLYEGFGLPPLEAMACGTPVIASDRSSIPEVVGEAAVLVSPTDPGRLADAIQTVLEDSRLRCRLRELGLRRAAQFSWRKMAERTLEAYEEAVSSHLDPARR